MENRAAVKSSSLIGSLVTDRCHAGKKPELLACAVSENEPLAGKGSGGERTTRAHTGERTYLKYAVVWILTGYFGRGG